MATHYKYSAERGARLRLDPDPVGFAELLED